VLNRADNAMYMTDIIIFIHFEYVSLIYLQL